MTTKNTEKLPLRTKIIYGLGVAILGPIALLVAKEMVFSNPRAHWSKNAQFLFEHCIEYQQKTYNYGYITSEQKCIYTDADGKSQVVLNYKN